MDSGATGTSRLAVSGRRAVRRSFWFNTATEPRYGALLPKLCSSESSGQPAAACPALVWTEFVKQAWLAVGVNAQGHCEHRVCAALKQTSEPQLRIARSADVGGGATDGGDIGALLRQVQRVAVDAVQAKPLEPRALSLRLCACDRADLVISLLMG